jgi:hypothetical protein
VTEKALEPAGFDEQVKAIHGTQIAESAGKSFGFDSKRHKAVEFTTIGEKTRHISHSH